MAYPPFDLRRLTFQDAGPESPAVTVESLVSLESAVEEKAGEPLNALGGELVKARNQGGATLFLTSADVLRSGVSLHLNDLIEKGLLTHVCFEPAAVLCDWELATTGTISACVESQLANRELISSLLAALDAGDAAGLGVGEALGSRILTAEFPHRAASVLAQGYQWGVPVTVHAAIGGALLHTVEGFDPGCVGRMLHRDFQVLANSVENLDDGVVYQFGGAEMAVAVYRTALAAARNVAAQYNRDISDFTAAVFSAADRVSDPGFTVASTVAENRRHSVTGNFSQQIPALRRAALNEAGWNRSAEQ